MLLKILILNFTIFILIVPENFDNCIDTEDETLSKNLFFSLCYRLGVELQTFQQKKKCSKSDKIYTNYRLFLHLYNVVFLEVWVEEVAVMWQIFVIFMVSVGHTFV